MTDDKLRDLCEAATPGGVWESGLTDDEDGIAIIARMEGVPAHGTPTNGIVALATLRPTEAETDDYYRARTIAAYIAAANPATVLSLLDRLKASGDQKKALVEALEWYGEQARLCRLIHSAGDAGRHALAGDGGELGRAALAKAKEPAHD